MVRDRNYNKLSVPHHLVQQDKMYLFSQFAVFLTNYAASSYPGNELTQTDFLNFSFQITKY